MSPPQAVRPLVYDIKDWAALDGYRAAQQVAVHLEQKGFCFINGFADDHTRYLAEREARELKRSGAMKCTPLEATGVLLGAESSCWTMRLSDPREDPAQDEEYLRKIDQCLDEVGHAIARSSQMAFAAEVVGRSAGLVHHSRMPQDPRAPKLVDSDEALEYIARASQRSVVLLYYLGPNASVISIAPREDTDRLYSVITKNPVIIAFRTDVCLLAMGTRGVSVTVEVDFMTRSYAGVQMSLQDELPVPLELGQWFQDRFEAIADDEVVDDDIPFDFQREAALRVHKSQAVRIAGLWHDLPSLPQITGSPAPFEASLLWGQDPVTEICSSRSRDDDGMLSVYAWGGKWDPDEYYDEDPMSASDFKMYTRHFAVLNRSGWDDFDPKEFGISAAEDFTMDHRARLLLESMKGSLHDANLDVMDVANKGLGFFVGLSGEHQYWDFLRSEAKIDKHSAANLSNATTVNRLAYHLRCNGPCVCIDTEESSGLVALETAMTSLRHNRCGPLSFASACHWIANPFETILQCAAGVVARSGRTRVYDESVDGFTKGEGVVTLLLQLEEGTGKERKDQQHALVTGASANSKGASSSLLAPSAAALVDVVNRAAKDAQKPFNVVDAVEVNAGGGRIADMVELCTLQKLLDTGKRDVQAVLLRASRSLYGNLGPVCGLVGVARTCVLIRRALHGPNLHLRQMLDLDMLMDDEDNEGRLRALPPLETVEARGSSQLVGVSAFGATGTNSHALLWGGRSPAEGGGAATGPRPSRPISWWPGGAPGPADPPLRGYYIVGTWAAWEQPCPMEEEAKGVYGYTLTMGENNWECFQVWIDEDPDQVLHPPWPRAFKEARVEGPNSDVPRDICWYITGIPDEVRLINEVQAKDLQLAEQAEVRGSPRPVVAFLGDYRPPGHEKAQDASGMPVVISNEQCVGEPGDRYRIRLHVRGKYKRLEWSKLPGPPVGVQLGVERAYVHKYHIIGDHSYWAFQEMARPAAEGGEEEGPRVAEVQLLREESRFQIFRDGDWEQGFYPASTSSDAGAEILGPDGAGRGKYWLLVGKRGDRFQVEFWRRRVDGKDVKSVRWQHLGEGVVDFAAQAKSHSYCVLGSWTGFQAMQEMRREEDAGSFSLEIVIGKSGAEAFQILLNANRHAAVYPDPDRGAESVRGPDNEGEGRYWVIGGSEQAREDVYSRGDHVRIHLDVQAGLPHRVWWEKYTSPDAHREYIAWGCQRIFKRHHKLLGLEPYDAEGRPARLAKRPDFLQPGARRGVLGQLLPLPSME